MARKTRRTTGIVCAGVAMMTLAFARPWTLLAQAPEPTKGVKFAVIKPEDTKEWLTYLASDALQGRQVFTEGYGLATSYIAEHLKEWGLKPIGDQGYFQTVKYRDYRVTRNSSITVEVNGQSKTFKHGDHVTFPLQAGGKQTLTFDGVDFAGYGIFSQPYEHNDFAGREVKGKLVMYLAGTPASVSQKIAAAQAAAAAAAGTAGTAGGRAGGGGRGATLGGNRSNFVTQVLGASAVLTFAAAPPAVTPTPAENALTAAEAALAQATQALADARAQMAPAGARGGNRGGGGGGGGGGNRGGAAATPADFRSVQNVNLPIVPAVTGDETFYEFLFSGSGSKFADLRAKATAGEPLPPFSVKAKVTINIDNQYDVLATQLTKNVVGMVEGSDPKLKDTYVMYGAHLDHVGYRTSPGGGRGGGRAGGGGAAGASGSAEPDLISNGADDDGSGSVGLLGIAKAFATGPKPKRSIVFVWHAGEEAGLLGSKYNADYPVVPLEKVQAQLNIDMIGRNRNNDPTQNNSVFVIGADRISTDLHNLVVDTNATLVKPVHLDYEYNDPNDSNSFYTRSDHYSYAVKGIPIAFFFTGTHPDYHQVSDHVDKILFPKLAAIAQLVYQTGFNIANTDKVLDRDNKGPRSGTGFEGKIKK